MDMKPRGHKKMSTAADPATYGGPGWRQRVASHRDDVRAGIVWHSCGSNSEFGTLRQVVLAWPDQVLPTGDPNDSLMLAWPDQYRLQEQAAAIGAFYESQDIAVHWVRSATAPPNIIFQRDLFFMTPEGAILARPGAAPRASEVRWTAATLAQAGVPILGVPRGTALLEGADALWLRPDLVLVGIGQRTNAEGAAFLASILRDLSVSVIPVALPPGVQHLLGVVNVLDRDLAAVRADKITEQLLGILRDAAIEPLVCAAGPEVADKLGMNFVTLSPRRIVMPNGAPSVRAVLTAAGVRVHELEIGEYVKAAGGLACLTGILQRTIDTGS
jgi:N-dimethylarginine dimethylaminohydrolase